MTKLWATLTTGCSSVAVALLAVGLLAAPAQYVWAYEPVETCEATADATTTASTTGDYNSCSWTQTTNSTTGVITCVFNGGCVKCGKNVGCNDSVTRNGNGQVTGCSTRCAPVVVVTPGA